MSNLRTTLTIAGVAACILLPACGGDDDGEPSAAVARPAATARPDTLPVAQYVSEVDALRKSIDDARSDFFHAENKPGVIERQTREVRKAYTAAAGQLDALAPPDAAAELHTQMLELWRKRSRELAEIVSAKSFDAGRASELLYGTDRDGALLDELYILPQ